MRPLTTLAILWTAAAALAATPGLDPTATRNAAGPAIGCVTVENKWGIPVAVATGFLLGDGKFLVTDLAAVAQPGADRVTVEFQDGARLTAREFGLADPGLGVVVLRVGGESPSRPGLALAQETPPLDVPPPVVSVGWRWGRTLEAAAGRAAKGPLAKDLAAKARVETPPGLESFLRIEGPRIEAASGSPVLDASGSVLGIRLDVSARDLAVSLAIPAALLRQAMLAATPQLKPLADLPRPLWPVHVLRLKGEPTAPADFGRAAQSLKASLACKTCMGKGKIDDGHGLRGLFADDVTCPVCRGELIAMDAPLYDAFATWAEQGVRILYSPTADERWRMAVRAAAADALKAVATAGRHFRQVSTLLTVGDFLNPRRPLPRGVMLFCQVRDVVDGPDGRYLILEPMNTAASVAMRAEDPAGPGKPGARRLPAVDSWILAAGAALSRYDSGKYQGHCLLALEWLPAPPPAPVAAPTRR